MGAGSFGAGIGPAGSDPVTVSPAAVPPTTTDTPFFDPFALVYPFDSTGELETTHPVWQRVALALGIRRGALRSTPDVGIPLERLRLATDLTAQREADGAVRVALADLLSAGDIDLVAVSVDLPWRGKFYADIRNLREAGAEPVRLGVSVN